MMSHRDIADEGGDTSNPTQLDHKLRLQRAMLSDKKMSGGVIDLIVPRGIGRCEVVSVPAGELRGWLAAAGLR